MFKRVLAVAAVAAFAVLGGNAAANAAPMPILPFGNSNTVVNANGVDFFQATNPVWGAAVNAGPANSVDDNFVTQSSGPNSVRFELVGSNLCVADPGPGYGNVDAIVLRTCNGKQWQAFKLVDRQSNGLSGVQSVATNQYVTDNGQFAGLTGVADNRPCAVGSPCGSGVVGANTFDSRSTQQWNVRNHRFFRPLVNLSVSQSQNTNTDTVHPALSSITYQYDVNNHGSVPVSVNLTANEAVTVHVDSDDTLAAGDYHLTLSQLVEAGQLVSAHSDVVDTQTVKITDHGTASSVTGPSGYSESLQTFLSAASNAHVHGVMFVETPAVTATANGHAVNHIHVSPATETATF